MSGRLYRRRTLRTIAQPATSSERPGHSEAATTARRQRASVRPEGLAVMTALLLRNAEVLHRIRGRRALEKRIRSLLVSVHRFVRCRACSHADQAWCARTIDALTAVLETDGREIVSRVNHSAEVPCEGRSATPRHARVPRIGWRHKADTDAGAGAGVFLPNHEEDASTMGPNAITWGSDQQARNESTTQMARHRGHHRYRLLRSFLRISTGEQPSRRDTARPPTRDCPLGGVPWL